MIFPELIPGVDGFDASKSGFFDVLMMRGWNMLKPPTSIDRLNIWNDQVLILCLIEKMADWLMSFVIRLRKSQGNWQHHHFYWRHQWSPPAVPRSLDEFMLPRNLRQLLTCDLNLEGVELPSQLENLTVSVQSESFDLATRRIFAIIPPWYTVVTTLVHVKEKPEETSHVLPLNTVLQR